MWSPPPIPAGAGSLASTVRFWPLHMGSPPQVCREGSCGEKATDSMAGKHGGPWGRARQPGVSRHNLVRQKYTPRAVTKGKRGHRMHSWKGESERGSGVMPAPLGMANAGTGGGAQRLHGTLTVTVGSGAPRMGRRKGVGNMG